MNCLKCNMPLENKYRCPHCGFENKVAKKIIFSSNWHYNQGLAKVKVRDLSGAIHSLNQSLKYNKRNIEARNLLGLVYYQMGEIVNALSQWVISVHFQSRDNRAIGFIEAIQNNPTMLKEANKVIRRYNQALEYVQDNQADLAIIELKKVVNMSPQYVRAQQLLALLYIQRKQYVAARKVLGIAVKIDRNNMTTLNYLKELNSLQSKDERKRKRLDNPMRIDDPNPVVIEVSGDSKYEDYSTSFISFVNVLIGIVIGAAVIWLLIVPTITKKKATEYNAAVVEYSAQLSERNRDVSNLQKQLAELQTDHNSSATTVVDDAGASESSLTTATVDFLKGDLSASGQNVASIDPAAITDPEKKKIYDILKEGTKDAVVDNLFAEAQGVFEQGEYLQAIDGLIKVLRMDDSYTRAIFYMGRSYQMLGDASNAIAYYQKLIQYYPNSSLVDDAQNYLNQIENATGVSIDSISTEQSAGE